jgi:membrane protein DedA with SNARE-associated domain
MLPIIRTFISLPAGVARMPFVRFSALTLAGCVPWVLGLALAGEAVGHEWKDVRKGFDYVDYAVVALVVLGGVYAVIRRRRRGGANTGDPAPDAA